MVTVALNVNTLYTNIIFMISPATSLLILLLVLWESFCYDLIINNILRITRLGIVVTDN